MENDVNHQDRCRGTCVTRTIVRTWVECDKGGTGVGSPRSHRETDRFTVVKCRIKFEMEIGVRKGLRS